MPWSVREMTDLEAGREMRNSNKQRGDPLPSELAKLLDLEYQIETPYLTRRLA